MAKTTKRVFESYDNSFYWLATQISQILAVNKLDETTQKQQVLELLEAEKAFKNEILKYKYSTVVYKKFIQKIRYIDRNILFSKIYFRESSEVFSRDITPCLKKEDAESLKRFNINFNLIKYIRDNWRGALGEKAEKHYKRVERARRVLQENNLPLVINAAKLFYRKVPKSSVSLMDMISVSCRGLSSAIDKYCLNANGEYSSVFCSVALGRASGELIREYSSTYLHFYPQDKRVLYKANSIKGRQGITDIVELANAINESFERDKAEGLNVPKGQVKPGELQDLVNAASIASVECTIDEENYNIYDRTPDMKSSAEDSMIYLETTTKIGSLIDKLPPLHKKVLRLKGINF